MLRIRVRTGNAPAVDKSAPTQLNVNGKSVKISENGLITGLPSGLEYSVQYFNPNWSVNDRRNQNWRTCKLCLPNNSDFDYTIEVAPYQAVIIRCQEGVYGISNFPQRWIDKG